MSLNLTNASILTYRESSMVELKAISALTEEIEKRTGVRLPAIYDFPEDRRPVIVIGVEEHLKKVIEPYITVPEDLARPKAEGYRIVVKEGSQPIILISGADPRGTLYGVGKFLRKLIWKKGSIEIPDNLAISSTPQYPLRGHQLGYRPKTNAYDAWTVEQYEQYIRELALFGANSIEILPPRTDDAPTSPHMKVPPLEMMIKLSEIIDSYGLDVWIWYPNMFSEQEYRDEACLRREIEEREEIFSKLKRIDAVFIPGGDAGTLEANTLFEWSEEVYKILNKYHPRAKIWLSPQFPILPVDSWYNDFYTCVKREPDWLGGIVFGPRVKTPLPELRKIIPEKYPIRHYPDITHSIRCQYPVKDWDLAFAITLGRECINPRPRAEKYIHNLFAPYTIGSLSYSEGINDDVNKFVWSDQDWNPDTPVIETLRDYARLFINPELTEEIAQGIMALEKNWEGPLLVNENVDVTLKQWQDIEKSAPQEVLNNYRFQMCLLRAYYDTYIRRRLIYETELEKKALEVLEQARNTGSLRATEEAEEILERAKTKPVAQGYKDRCWKLADELFKNIGAQLSVEKYGAQSWERGAFMDDIDMPLNNYNWLKVQFDLIRKMDDEDSRLEAINEILNRINPGPGGFYDNLGHPSSWAHVRRVKILEDDFEEYFLLPSVAFSTPLLHLEKEKQYKLGGIPLAWITQISTPYQLPLVMIYKNLNPQHSYRIRVTYIGGSKVKLIANDKYLIHNFIDATGQCLIKEFSIPQEALSPGELVLAWSAPEESRGVSIAEVWLMNEKD